MQMSALNKQHSPSYRELPSNKLKILCRACRLKKKAQHEANKIKLYGLEQEHKGMLAIIEDARTSLMKKVELGPNGIITASPPHLQSSPNTSQSSQGAITQHLEKLCKMRNSECSLVLLLEHDKHECRRHSMPS